MIAESIFKAYDIRGVVDETLTIEAVELIGKAFGSEALAQSQQTVVIARDGRLSSPKIAEALRLRRFKEGLERLREEAKRRFIEEQERLEQKESDEGAIISFARKKINPVGSFIMRNNMTQKGKISNGVNRGERKESSIINQGDSCE